MDTELTFLRDVLIIFAVAVTVVTLLRKIHVPPIAGFILSGALVGPNALGLITDVHDVQTLAEVGVVLLLFGIGLEFGWQRIRQVGTRVVFIALVEMTIMVVLGYEIGILLGWTSAEGVFLGAALSVSSSK